MSTSTTSTTSAESLSTGTASLPATGTWLLDTSHTRVEAVARHLMVTKVRVAFTEFSGTVQVAEPITDSQLDVTLQAASISSGDEQRDGHLRSGDFLDVENHPELTYRSTSIDHVGGDDYVVHGELTIRGTTRPVDLSLTYLGTHTDPWGGAHAAFEASGEIDREEFDITWNQALEAGGVLVSKKVALDFDVQLVQPDAG